MGEITTGVDIIEVDRIRKSIEEMEDKFLAKIYTESEIEYCSKATSEDMKYQHFAGRFAAKEAIFKALSKKIKSREDILWKQIEIMNEQDGRPKVNIDKLNIQNLKCIDLSISHIKDYAIANVVVMFEA